MSDERGKKEVVKDDETNYSNSPKEQVIIDIPEIDVGKIRNYYINEEGHMVDDED